MTLEKALEKATTVYRRLLAQGRSEPDARRDAERWVKGNFDVDVTLPAPVRRKQTGHVYATRIEYGAATINYSHFASAATAVSENMADLFRTLKKEQVRQQAIRRASIYADITRLEAQREMFARQAREATRDGFDATAGALWAEINDLTRRIEWHREQMRNA